MIFDINCTAVGAVSRCGRATHWLQCFSVIGDTVYDIVCPSPSLRLLMLAGMSITYTVLYDRVSTSWLPCRQLKSMRQQKQRLIL